MRKCKTSICHLRSTAIALLLMVPAIVFGSEEASELNIEASKGGDDFRTRQVRQYFERLGRTFEIYRLSVPAPEEASYTAGTQTYHLDRKRTGNLRYNSLKVSSAAFYKAVARSINSHFVSLEDSVNRDGSGVTGSEFLQMVFRQARALDKVGADLDTVDNRVTVTYVYDGQHLIVAPTTFNFVDNAVNTRGTALHSKSGVNNFSKHYMLALILNDKAEVTMAGKIYIRVLARDSGQSVDMSHVFAANGEVDLAAYEFELTVSNESGTFKPLAAGLPPFADVLVNALDQPQLQYRSKVLEGQESLQGVVYSADL
jgi:hypothetical protein